MKLLIYILLLIPIIGYSQYPHTPNFNVRTVGSEIYVDDEIVETIQSSTFITNGISPMEGWDNQCVLIYMSQMDTPDIVLPIGLPSYFNEATVAGYPSYFYQLEEDRYNFGGECTLYWDNIEKILLIKYQNSEIYFQAE